MIDIRIKTRFWSIVLFLPIFFIALNCSTYTNRITNFDSRKDQIRKKYINDPRLSPIKNKKMKGMPDTLIVLAECDPLHDEGLLYGKKLEENNVKVEIKVYKGLMHGFLTMGGVIKEVKSVINFTNKKINELL